jgi:hypothetical protein
LFTLYAKTKELRKVAYTSSTKAIKNVISQKVLAQKPQRFSSCEHIIVFFIHVIKSYLYAKKNKRHFRDNNKPITSSQNKNLKIKGQTQFSKPKPLTN